MTMNARRTFTVYLNVDYQTDPARYDVVVGPGDAFRAEIEARRQGLPTDREAAQFGHLVVQLWCAVTRQTDYAAPFQTFIADDLYDFSPQGEDVPVPPTEPLSDSGSSSPTTSPEPSPTEVHG